ncbi:MAG: N-6 DNA methylase [Nanoarchaeota archaeon]|mgnify:CR=1 FL=1
MLSKEEAKEKLKQLIQEFSEGEKYWDSKPEEDIKHQFIEPLFEDILGWGRKDISKEQRVLKGRADYILKNGNQEVLVVEAKKTNVLLKDEEGRQAVSYAYHRKIKFSVLTNFKYLYVYHALSNIKNIGKNLLKVNNEYFRLDFKDFLDKFDVLWLLSKESFEKGEINKLLSAKDEKLNKPIDVTILNDLLNIRSWLSKDLKSKKNYLTQEVIDEVVQIMIDRLIFIRSVEDRGLEPMNYLRSLESDVREQRTKLQLFHYILEKFEEFNQKYDSRLFEKGLLEKEGAFSEDSLRKVILALYFGSENNQERYMFDQIPGDLFGSIYEQYLGTILAGTEKRVTLDSSSGKRKKMGIYYTPSYIVDYIVKNTVHEYIKDKTIDEILNVKILDPACGSGSFITRAFTEVCNTIKEKLNEGKEGSKILFKKSKDKIEELSLGQKIEVLKSCIYGVDLDEKAVEIARLNLLLKLLDGETQESRKLLLPHLENNIKCGNSLIDDTKVSDRAFKWEVEFKEVMNSGGFDVVVGNPPYGAELLEKDRELLEKKFKLGNTDTACLFMALAVNLLKSKGTNGFIIPKPFVYSSTWKEIREKLLAGLTEIVDVGKVWKEVKLEQVIYFYNKDKNERFYDSCVRSNQEIKQIGKINKETFKEFGFLLNGISEKELNIGRKIKNAGVSLNELVINQRGAIYQKEITEEKSDLKVLGGMQIGRYVLSPELKGYISKKIIKDEKANIKQNSILVQRLVAHIEHPIDHIKITASLVRDLKINDYIIVDTINQLQNKSKFSSELLIAIINSKLTNWYAYRFIFGKAIRTMQFDNPVTKRITIPKVSSPKEKKLIELVNQMLELQRKYHNEKVVGNEKERLKQQIDNVDYEIDQEIYKLYELTPEEIKIVEEREK